MRVRFHGAAGEVTGSMHEVEAAGHRLLLDCGMVQGGPAAEARNADAFAFEPAALDAVVASHAHIDHVGRLPLLVRRGFRGPVFAQAATADLLPVMLEDAAGIAEHEAERARRRDPGRRPPPAPLFDRDDVARLLRQLRPLPYDVDREILPGVHLHLREAGHILGSASVELRADGRTLAFSGDLGPRGTPILRDPAPVPRADLVLLEATYGDRLHRARGDTVAEIGDILDRAWREGGSVLIPAFAVGRSQELLYWFARHWDDWQLRRWRIVLDSPMASRVVAVYRRHRGLFDADAQAQWRDGPDPFALPNLHVTESVEQSQAINRVAGGVIVVAGSGMANAGRIVHHLRHRIGRRETHVVFVGYQAEGTLGRRLVDGAHWVRLHGRDHRVGAQVHTVGGLSAHADQAGLLDWYGAIDGRPPVALVHGEPRAREALAGELGERLGAEVLLPEPGDARAV
ncbi:MBL fold metallo-hydrolase [Tolypothrix campylonemoides VB511288]|nr:MBL fold metallo-hydrolase [Tolypothrix campylonemoides VB511288]